MKIAIIAGCGNFPIQIARQKKDAFVLCIEGYSYQNLFENKSETVSLLDPLHWLTILKNNNITHIVMAGKINRPANLNNISNEKANELINQIISVGDNAALNYIEEFFNKNGFKILPVNSILKDCFFSKGFYEEELFPLNFKKFVSKNFRKRLKRHTYSVHQESRLATNRSLFVYKKINCCNTKDLSPIHIWITIHITN